MTSSDETLALAALAAGYDLTMAMVGTVQNAAGTWPIYQQTLQHKGYHRKSYWAPDIDDGDSSRLRAALLIDTILSNDSVQCNGTFGSNLYSSTQSYADHANNRDAAIRHATLLVAAEIGRARLEDINVRPI